MTPRSILDATNLEMAMLRAFVMAGDERGQRVAIDGDGPELETMWREECAPFAWKTVWGEVFSDCENPTWSSSVIHIQRENNFPVIDKTYRKDFRVSFVSVLPFPGLTDDGSPCWESWDLTSSITVEADGPYHDTPDQVHKDKIRDRMIQKGGDKVFRFTYREIQDNAIGRAREVLRVLWNEHLANIDEAWRKFLIDAAYA